MRIFVQEECGIVVCPGCMNEWEWEPCDLEVDKQHPDMYYVVCPYCKDRMWLKRNESLDKIFDEYNNPHRKTQYESC